MARAAGARSQRQASQPTQTQTNGRSQTQRNGRRGRVQEDEEDEDVEVNEDEEEQDDDGDDHGDDDLERKANSLVRLALFYEQTRRPLRRDEISKRVMGSKARQFNAVFARAQEILRKTLGMEMVELQNRAQEKEDTKDKDKSGKGDKEQKNALGMKKKAAPTGTKSYILRSVLDPQLIQIATSADPDILRIEQADLTADDKHVFNEDEETSSQPAGAILAWDQADSLGTIGLLYVILSLILVHGRSLGDSDLKSLLRRLRLTPTTLVPRNARTPNATMTVEAFLNAAIRQGYLDCQRIGDAKGAQKKRGRATATQGANDEGVTIEWHWGPRAMAEVGEHDIARFVAEFMVERTRAETQDGDDDEADIENDPDAKKMRDGMIRGIERAAGGELVPLM